MSDKDQENLNGKITDQLVNNAQSIGVSGNIYQDEAFHITPEEEEMDVISKDGFSNSKLSLNVGEERKADEIADEKEDSLPDQGKEREIPPEFQEETVKTEGDAQQTEITVSAQQQSFTSMEVKNDHLKDVDDTKLNSLEVDSDGTPLTNLHLDKKETNLPPQEPIVNLMPEKAASIMEVDKITEGSEKGNETFSELQEETREDDAQQSEIAKKTAGQKLSIKVIGTKDDHLKDAANDIYLDSLEAEYGTPPTDIHPDKRETNSTPLEPNVSFRPEKPAAEPGKERPAWMQEKEKCLNASLEERKKKRKCTELSSIKTWPEYFNENLNVDNEEAEAESSVICNKVSIWKGDITSLLIDAIVNAANERLLGGGGVDGAIHSAAGPYLKEECYKFGGRSAGESVITAGYNLPARYVIHTVGPRGEKPDKLRECYRSSLDLLIGENQRSIAFPCISTGIFAYPNDKAAEVALKTVREWLEENHEKVDRVIFCLFLETDVRSYQEKMQQHFPMLGGHTASSVAVAPENIPFGTEENQQDFPKNVVSRNTSIPGELEKQDMKTFYADETIQNHPIEHEDGETRSLISTDQKGSKQDTWNQCFECLSFFFPCCSKRKTS